MKRLFPALRPRLADEEKALTLSGGYGAYTIPRTTTFGLRDAAAGWDMEAVIQDGYERVVWVYKAVEIIAGNASRLPFVIKDGEDEVESHPLLRVLNKRANPLETGRAFRKRLSAQILLSKRGAFVEVTRSRGGDIVRLDLLDPDRVRIVPDLAGDYVSHFEYVRPDGVTRNLSPERVRWIRENHPIDPFSGVTPLEPAGMSVELDRLARQYNVSFINRDGRPGGVIGVDTDGLPSTELDRIARLFTPGAAHAGTIHAIGVGKGGMNYIDTSARPRDMAYETTSDKAKKEILAAFGVPESMAGNASERTFDNAEQEEFNFWHDPMLPHLDLIAAAFDGDVDDELDCGFDTSSVEALELPARRRRAEAREEFEAGVRTIKEYRDVAKLDVIDSPQTRALWISPAKAPVPGQDTDAAALGIDTGTAGGMPPGPVAPGGPTDPGVEPGATAQEVVEQALADGATTETIADDPEGPAAAAVTAARQEDTDDPDAQSGAAEAAVAAARMEGKALTIVDAPTAPTTESYDPGDDASRRLEMSVAATLESLLARQASVIAARLESPRHRRGTPYWVAESADDTRGGDAAIDTIRVIDAQQWIAQAQEDLRPTVSAASQEAATGLLAALAASGALVGAAPLLAAASGAGHVPAAAADVTAHAAKAAAKASLFALTTAHLALEEWLGERAADIDHILSEQVTPDLPSVLVSVRQLWERKARTFAESLAVTVAQTAVLGAREEAAATLVPQVAATPAGSSYLVEVPPEVLRVWRTRDDENVRAAHRAAEGQVVGLREPFVVGGHEMRFPSDPLAPPALSRWCRCWIRYEWSEGAKFTVERNPSDLAEAA